MPRGRKTLSQVRKRNNYERNIARHNGVNVDWDESASISNLHYFHYYQKFWSIAINRFEWLNMPSSVDVRYMEQTLLSNGQAIFFKIPDMLYPIKDVTSQLIDSEEMYVALSSGSIPSGMFDIYGQPLVRQAYSARTNFRIDLTADNSVIIYDNFNRYPALASIEYYATKLAKIEQIIDQNLELQKTPYVIETSEEQLTTMQNYYRQISSMEPAIFVNMDGMNKDGSKITVHATGVDLKAIDLADYRNIIINDFYTQFGIENSAIDKKERVQSAEVNVSNGGTSIYRVNALSARKQACELINLKYGLNVDVQFATTELSFSDEEREENDRMIEYEQV